MSDEQLTDEQIGKLHTALRGCVQLAEQAKPARGLPATSQGLDQMVSEFKIALAEVKRLEGIVTARLVEIARLNELLGKDLRSTPYIEVRHWK